MKLRYTRRALADIGEIHEYIAAENPAAARRVADELERVIGQLEKFPELGRIGRIEDTRELVVARYPYVVAYREHNDEVHILSVIHSARAWPDSL